MLRGASGGGDQDWPSAPPKSTASSVVMRGPAARWGRVLPEHGEIEDPGMASHEIITGGGASAFQAPAQLPPAKPHRARCRRPP